MRKSKSAFTIVELLIVIVVIGILAAIVIVAYNGVQTRAAASRSISDLKHIQKSLELYKATNGTYPETPSNNWLNSDTNPTDYVPGLTSGTIAKLPTPQFGGDGSTYMYRSNGTDYKIMAHGGQYQTLCPIVKEQYPEMVPSRDCWAYAFYSPGGRLF